jgi:hypothetical protein
VIKQFRIMVVLLALTPMSSFHVSAGQVVFRKADPQKREQIVVGATYLKSDVFEDPTQPNSWVFKVTNNTNASIPTGTTIYFSINTLRGSFALAHPLSPGQAHFARTVQPGPGYTPKTWYFK